MFKRLLLGISLSAALAVAAAAQTISVPQVQSMGQNDLVQVVPGGLPSAQEVFATPGAIGGVLQYSQQTPLTAFTITVPNATSFLYLTPAGTLATGTLTMEAAPVSDGQKFCLLDTQTQTAITIAANTGQSLGGLANPTALVAGTTYCWFYNAQTATWYRIQ
ncbi:hypothetical protein SAMN05216337_1017134 [Bradyrhizobium brasilense]|uniref:DUF4402 domain-containing protein n=1 Tax=Bradyrhizobium brasilense TaxID=1419277 RepID=A0A1G6YXH7_9BRAD|nr:hypothetical protein [Bradyrhizobium brasilense]SDD95050.1 hypothetical protein SAMN05216337_1017134 [Bradyrhizobium brasilense]